MKNFRAPETQVSEVSTIRDAIASLTRIKTRAEILGDGRKRFAVISRKELMARMLEIVELFVSDRIRQANAQLNEILQERERSARDEGRLRVLQSLAEFADVMDTTLDTIAGESAEVSIRALDKRIDRIFKSYGFARIPSTGASFDPLCHEAIEERQSQEHASGTVIQEVARGYHSGDFVLRPAKVIVAS